ncbi:MAG: dephospho-CoA kinase [Bacillota bacterium]
MGGEIKVAICGRMRAGKGVLAGYATLFFDFYPVAFGDAMKDAAHRAFPHVARTPKPRALYQSFGEWARSHFGATVWVDAVERKIAGYCAMQCCKPARILVTDLRVQAEYDWLRANGYTIIRVSAPAELRLERARQAGDEFSEADFEHETETAVDSFHCDYEIRNEGTSEEMTDQFDAIMAEIGVSEVDSRL